MSEGSDDAHTCKSQEQYRDGWRQGSIVCIQLLQDALYPFNEIRPVIGIFDCGLGEFAKFMAQNIHVYHKVRRYDYFQTQSTPVLVTKV